MFVRWLVLAYSVFMQEIYFVVMLRCWQLVTFNSALLCLYDEKEFTILMVKKLLLPWKLLIFTMSCREQSIWGKKKTNTKNKHNVFRGCSKSFIEPIPEKKNWNVNKFTWGIQFQSADSNKYCRAAYFYSYCLYFPSLFCVFLCFAVTKPCIISCWIS